MKKIVALAKAALPVMIGMGVLVIAAKWGDDNDIPILSDIYDVIS